MKSVTVKMLAALAVAGGSAFVFSPAQALPALDRGVAAGRAPMIEKSWCGPYGCRPGGGDYGYGYGWRPHPRPWGYGYGWRSRPWTGGWGYGGRGWGGGRGPRW